MADEGSEAPSAIDAPERKSAAVGRGKEAPASGQPECSGVLRSFLTPQRASPRLAPLAPPHTGSPPAFARRAPRPGLRRRVAVRSSPPHHVSGPRSAAESLGMRFGNVFREIGACWLALPPPGAHGIKRFLVTPGASALVPRLCSLVVPAGTLDAAPSGGGWQLSFRLSPKQVGSTCWAGNRWGGDDQTGFGQRLNPVRSRGGKRLRGWSGESAGQAGFGRDPSARSGVAIRSRVLRTTPAIPRPRLWRVGIG